MLMLIIIVLAIANIATLFLMFNQHDKRSALPKEGIGKMESFLKNKVGFNNEQIAQYDSLFNQHKKTMQMEMQTRNEAVKQLYESLASTDYSDSSIFTVSNQHALQQATYHRNFLKHLRAIRSLCNSKEQTQKFDEDVYTVFERKPKKN